MTLFRRVLTYRLTLYYLAATVLAALALSVLGIVHQPWMNLAFSTAVALSACLGVNWAFARVFQAKSNWESVCISALIIALIITPVAPGDLAATGFLVLVSAWAMASKYIIASGKRHLFNPAAFGAAIMGIGFHRTVSWWIGDNAVLLPLIVLGGALILTRLRYTEMLAAYALVVLGIAVAHGNVSSLSGVAHAISMTGVHSMFGFFGLVMLTEPRTAPLGRWRQISYGALVGLLFSPFTHVGGYYFTPEVAILCGNLFAFLSNKRRIRRWAGAFAWLPVPIPRTVAWFDPAAAIQALLGNGPGLISEAKGQAMTIAKNTICLWYDKDAEAAARFYADTFPDSSVDAVHRAPSDYPSGKAGDVLTVEFKVAGIPCLGLNGGTMFNQSEAFSFQIATDDQEETDRYWNAIVGNGGQESACGWCKDKWGVSWQITPRVLTEAMAAGGDEAKRAFDAMMSMRKIDVAAIKAARRG